ncbi:hypothetical protein ZWY2020_020524 [Hordeum vulgare]|nr:hypothetical protein ZWY2020_020524 [Hordeum vulgare]
MRECGDGGGPQRRPVGAGAAAAVADACRAVGFFRATNHGVLAALTDALEERAAAFFALPHKDKMDASARPFGYGSKNIGCNGDVGWLEYILLSVRSGSVAAASPAAVARAALEEYTDAVREVGARCWSSWRTGSASRRSTAACCGGWLRRTMPEGLTRWSA